MSYDCPSRSDKKGGGGTPLCADRFIIDLGDAAVHVHGEELTYYCESSDFAAIKTLALLLEPICLWYIKYSGEDGARLVYPEGKEGEEIIDETY